MKTIGDEQIKAYFLGKLPEPEAESIEIECASSAESAGQAQDVERELTDDYLRGNLSAEDVRLFEENYLVTEARHRKLHVAKGLWKIANETTPLIRPVIDASPDSFWHGLFGRRRVFQLACGGLVLLAVFCAAVYWLNSAGGKNEVAGVEEANPPSKNENPPVRVPDGQIAQNSDAENQNPESVASNSSVQNKLPDREFESTSKNPPEAEAVTAPKNIRTNKSGKPALAMVVKLVPGSLRDEGEQFVEIPANVKNLNILLSPAGEPNNYKIYRAVLKTPEDGVVFTSPNLKSLSFTISAEQLENRTYIISLEGQNPQNEFESIADYTFRVRR